MCRALTVLCVAERPEALRALKAATVAAEWELLAGATSADEALVQLEAGRPHVLVAFGPFEGVVAQARARYPSLRIVTDRPSEHADRAVSGPEEVRAAILGAPGPGGPVR